MPPPVKKKIPTHHTIRAPELKDATKTILALHEKEFQKPVKSSRAETKKAPKFWKEANSLLTEHPSKALGTADFRCNACNKIFKRALGWKLWTPSFCESTGKNARLYRISSPK